MLHHSLPDSHHFYFAQLKMRRLYNMLFFRLRHTIPKQTSLTVMIFKTLAALLNFFSFNLFGMMRETSFLFVCHEWTPAAGCIGVIISFPVMILLPHKTILLVVINRCMGTIYRDFSEIRSAETYQLCVCIGE